MTRRRLELTVKTHNIQNTPDLPRRAVRAAARAVTPFDFAGLQEIREHQDRIDVRRGIGPTYRLTTAGHRNLSTPIASNRLRWALDDTEVLKLHDGDASIPTPGRYFLSAAYRLRVRTHPPLRVVNGHAINGAFNRNHPGTRDERADLWHTGMDEVLYPHLRELRAEGVTAIVVGDFNFPRRLRLAADQLDVFNTGIDKMIVLPGAGVTASVLWRDREDTPSDHHALGARLRLTW